MARAPSDDWSSRAVRASPRYRRELRALGLRVRTLRDERKWTQQVAAERIEIDVTHLNKIERGVVNVTFGTLVRIADGFDVPLGALFPTPPRTRRR